MKKTDLTALGLTDELAEQIIVLHGKDIESHKSKLVTAQTEIDGLKTQLTEAGTTIEGFKKMDVDGIKAAADDYKAKFEQAQTEAQKQITALKFEHALDGVLTSEKAKNLKAVKALLSSDALKLNEDGSILGLKEQLEKIKSENDYLFEPDGVTPKIVTSTNSKPITGDPVIDAARKAAGLVIPEPKK